MYSIHHLQFVGSIFFTPFHLLSYVLLRLSYMYIHYSWLSVFPQMCLDDVQSCSDSPILCCVDFLFFVRSHSALIFMVNEQNVCSFLGIRR